MAKENNNKFLGVSAPLDDSLPKEFDLEFTKKLEECLKSFNLFESDDEMIHRVNVLSQLNDVAQKWIQEKSKSKNSGGDVLQICGKLFTFGSFRLGVHTKGADIDTLLVAPRNISREDFFRSFPSELLQMSSVEYVRCIEDAFVPVIKTKIGGIELDILFARLALKTIPDDLDLKSNELLRNLDPKCVRSLNGSRVTDDILSLVPNKEEFKLSLRAIKLWAKQRGIYSNVLGYLGGVSWAMLVARTCQLLPNATAATIVHKFFSIFIEWPWPKPVLLREYKSDGMNLDLPIWDPIKNPSDRYHLMPIITPSYPQQNSTFNVTASTRRIMMNEFKCAKQISDEIIEGKREWRDLFETFHFFSNHKCFIVLLVASIAEWTGFVESKIRHLVQILEHHKYINYAHVNPKAYSRTVNLEDSSNEKGIDEEQTMWFIGLNFDKSFPKNIDLTDEIKHFISLVRQAAAQRFKEYYKIDVTSVTRKGLTNYLPKQEIKNPKIRNSSSGTLQDETSQSSQSISLVDETPIKRKIDSDEEDPKRWRLGESEADPC